MPKFNLIGIGIIVSIEGREFEYVEVHLSFYLRVGMNYG